jgi:N-acetylneuraminic acid mutarotase
MKQNILLFLACLMVFDSAIGWSQSWQSCASLPESMVPSAVAVNGKIYALRVNNFYKGNLTAPSTMYEYDPAADTWTAKAPMSTIRTLFGMIALNRKIYVIGGVSNATYANFVSLADVEVYDPATGAWETKTSMPKPLYVFGIAASDGKIYVVGGVSKTSNGSTLVSTTSNQLYEYTPETDAWTLKADMSKYRSWSDAVAANGSVYGIGGNNSNNQTGNNDIEEYDEAKNTWTEKTTFVNGFDGQCQSVAINGKIYTLSSDITSSGSYTKAVIGEFDPATGTWTEKTQMLTPMMDFGKIVCDNKLYMIGGHLVSGMTFTAKALQYDPAANAQMYLPDISQWFNAVAEVGGVIYLIGGTNSSGSFIKKVVKLDTKTLSTSVKQSSGKAESFHLRQNYPNPFNPSTRIDYNIDHPEFITLKVFDVLGKEIALLAQGRRNAGRYSVQWNASAAPSGVYFCRLEAGGMVQTQKITVAK